MKYLILIIMAILTMGCSSSVFPPDFELMDIARTCPERGTIKITGYKNSINESITVTCEFKNFK